MLITFFYMFFIFFFKQKTAYELRISAWISDVCSSDLHLELGLGLGPGLDGVEDLRDLVEAGLRLGVGRIFLPLRLADEVADAAPHRRLGDEVDVGVGIALPALALDDPARLAAARIVAGAQHRVAAGNALAALAAFIQRAVLHALLVAQLPAVEVANPATPRRLGVQVRVGGGGGLPVRARDSPARLAAARFVACYGHRVAEGNALAVLAVFLQRAVLQALLVAQLHAAEVQHAVLHGRHHALAAARLLAMEQRGDDAEAEVQAGAGIADLRAGDQDRKSTRLNSSH